MNILSHNTDISACAENNKVRTLDHPQLRTKLVHNDGLISLDKMTATGADFPIILLVKIMLFPIAVAGFLAFLVLLSGKPFGSDYLILSLVALSFSSMVFQKASLFRSFNKFPVYIAFRKVLGGWIIVASGLLLLTFLTGLYIKLSSQILLIWVLFTPCLLVMLQALAWRILHQVISKTKPVRNAVMVGMTELASELRSKITEDRLLNIHIRGYFDDRNVSRLPFLEKFENLGSLRDVAKYVNQNSVDIVCICLPNLTQIRLIELMEALQDTTASIYLLPNLGPVNACMPRLDRIGGIPLIAVCDTPLYSYRAVIKRIIDIVFSLTIVLLLWPMMLAIGIGVKLTSPGPMIFRQRRYGLDGQEIVVYKFRTMHVCEDGDTIVQVAHRDKRVTSFGRFLRRTSLDELPQFINVLKGDMSIVGPRPHAVLHNEIYRKVISGYMLRHKVKPGISGWAQINGLRGETANLEEMKARVEHDLHYLRNWSPSFDIMIMLKTIRLVVCDKKAY